MLLFVQVSGIDLSLLQHDQIVDLLSLRNASISITALRSAAVEDHQLTSTQSMPSCVCDSSGSAVQRSAADRSRSEAVIRDRAVAAGEMTDMCDRLLMIRDMVRSHDRDSDGVPRTSTQTPCSTAVSASTAIQASSTSTTNHVSTVSHIRGSAASHVSALAANHIAASSTANHVAASSGNHVSASSTASHITGSTANPVTASSANHIAASLTASHVAASSAANHVSASSVSLPAVHKSADRQASTRKTASYVHSTVTQPPSGCVHSAGPSTMTGDMDAQSVKCTTLQASADRHICHTEV